MAWFLLVVAVIFFLKHPGQLNYIISQIMQAING
jgi:hypothetical protein